MTLLHDIFQKRKTQKKKVAKPKILVDYREKSSLVPSELIGLGLEVEFKELKVGDYLVNGTAIERKTISDFISSMINRRLLNQLEELQQYKNRLLLIEGFDAQELYNDKNTNGVASNAIRGFLLSVILKHKVPVMFTKDYKDTARFIAVLSKKQEKEAPLNVSKRALTKKEQLQFIIEGFPGIGPTTAKKLLKEFKSIKNIINASEEDLKKIIGKKGEVIKKIVDKSY